jgi:hypothetical protein
MSYRFSPNNNGLYAQPFMDIDVVQGFHPSYTESGANSLDMHMDSKYYAFFRSYLGGNFGKDFCIGKNFTFTPNIKAAWMKSKTLGNRNFTGDLTNVVLPKPNFTVKGFNQSPSQLLIGGSLQGKIRDRGMILAEYSAALSKYNKTQEVKVKLDFAY